MRNSPLNERQTHGVAAPVMENCGQVLVARTAKVDAVYGE